MSTVATSHWVSVASDASSFESHLHNFVTALADYTPQADPKLGHKLNMASISEWWQITERFFDKASASDKCKVAEQLRKVAVQYSSVVCIPSALQQAMRQAAPHSQAFFGAPVAGASSSGCGVVRAGTIKM